MSEERWRDIGGGRVQDEVTKKIATLGPGRTIQCDVPEAERTMTFTVAEWAKLQALADKRTTHKHTYTPRGCVRQLVKSIHLGPNWVHPATESA